MPFGGVHLRQLLDLRQGLVFAAPHDAGSAAIEFDQRLPSRKILSVELHRRLEFLARFFRERYRRKPAGMIGLFSIRSPEPLVVDRVLGVDGHRLLHALDRRVMLLQLQITLRQQQLHLAILRSLGRGCLQRLDGLHIVAGFVSPPPRFELRFLLHICRRNRRAGNAKACEQPPRPLNHSIVPEY